MQDIPWYEWLYAITRDWNIWSYPKRHWNGNALYKWRFLKQNSNGRYLQVTLIQNNNKKILLVHRLVAITYLDNSNNLPCINHKNGIKTDNTVDNLEWCTHSENQSHAYKLWRKKRGKNLCNKTI